MVLTLLMATLLCQTKTHLQISDEILIRDGKGGKDRKDGNNAAVFGCFRVAGTVRAVLPIDGVPLCDFRKPAYRSIAIAGIFQGRRGSYGHAAALCKSKKLPAAAGWLPSCAGYVFFPYFAPLSFLIHALVKLLLGTHIDARESGLILQMHLLGTCYDQLGKRFSLEFWKILKH